MSSTATVAPAAASAERMPPGIPYIVANEFAERFCYYGVNAILTVYMVQHLHFGQAQATVWQSLFKFGAYFAPLIGAIIADVFWGKFKTIMTLAIVYCVGCAVIAFVSGTGGLALGLFLMALGTGGIKPCVSTNVGDQFTSKNQHLIERAFSYFYLSINAGSSISIYFCPELLQDPQSILDALDSCSWYWKIVAVPLSAVLHLLAMFPGPNLGQKLAFGLPSLMMFVATVVFWLGRKRFVVVPPAMTEHANRGLAYFGLALVPALAIAVWVFSQVGAEYRTLAALFALLGQLILIVWLCLNTGLKNKLPPQLRDWMIEAFTGPALKQITGLAFIYYIFVAIFWSLWEQSNGQTWTLQATSDLMDKHLFGFLAGVPALSGLASYEMLPAQIQVVNGLFILGMVPVFTFAIYPLLGGLFTLTPLRKIGIGLWVLASSYLIVADIERKIMHGETVSLWWQIFAYMVLTASEVLISITALEFSYKQAPLKVKSFIMAATYLLSVSIGNAFTAQVNGAMVKPLDAVAMAPGEQTWVSLKQVAGLQTGQKIDFDGDNGLSVAGDDGQPTPLAGTFLIDEIDAAGNRVRLADAVHRKPVASSGDYKAASATVSTYKLVGPDYFLFFAAMGGIAALLFMFVAGFYREQTHVRDAEA